MNDEIRRLIHAWGLYPDSTTALGIRSFGTIDAMADYLDIALANTFDEGLAQQLRDYRTIENRIARDGQLGYLLSIPWSFHQSLGDSALYTLDECAKAIAKFVNVTATYTTSWSEILLRDPVALFRRYDAADIRIIHKAHLTDHPRKWKHIKETLDRGVPREYAVDIEFEYEALVNKGRGVAGFSPSDIAELHSLGVPADYANELNVCVLGSVYRRPERIHEMYALGMPASYMMDANDACLQNIDLIESTNYESVLQAWKDGIPSDYLLA